MSPFGVPFDFQKLLEEDLRGLQEIVFDECFLNICRSLVQRVVYKFDPDWLPRSIQKFLF